MPSLFFAVLSEAKPWIQKTKAKPVPHSGKFRIYQNESMHIVIAGTGKVAMALAVSEFAHRFTRDERNQMKIWNVGIAGSANPNWDVGEYFWIHKISDHASKKDYYLERIVSSQFTKETNLTTFDRPIAKIKNENPFLVLNDEDLKTISLVDMEGSGFFEAASLYFPLENLAIGKVVSDHLEGSFCQQETVETLMEKVMPNLYEEWIQPIPWITDDGFDRKLWPNILSQISDLRLTETMKHDLKRSLRFFHLRYPNSQIPFPNMEIIPTLKSKTDLKRFIDDWKKNLHV